MSQESVHPRIAEVIDILETTHRELVQLITAMPADRRNAPSPDERWSVAQNVEHLAVVEDGTGRLISKLVKQLAETGARETETSPIGNSIDQYHISTTGRRINAPEFVQPKEGLSTDDALARLTASRTRLIDAFRKGSGLALASVSQPHPAVGPLNVYQWGLITAQHVRRHITQIRDVAGLADA